MTLTENEVNLTATFIICLGQGGKLELISPTELSYPFQAGGRFYSRKVFVTLHFWSHRDMSNATTGYPPGREVFCHNCS